MERSFLPRKQGLYEPSFEHDACGVGFVCNVQGQRSNLIVKQGLEVLKRLSHRGATGADPKTGDGAGILIQTPHDFFVKAAQKNKINLPEIGDYGTGLIFLPQDKEERNFCKKVFAKVVKEQEQVLLGWRKVPVDNSDIGAGAKKAEPVIEQVFISATKRGGPAKNYGGGNQLVFERKLYIIRKQIENNIRGSKLKQKSFFCITNISSRTFLYKGLLMPQQVDNFFLDLKEESLKSALCIIHSRYSTNTFPAWNLSQPFRFLAHNGEINTLRGNMNWMRAREGLLKNDIFGEDIEKLKPIIVLGGSDSAAIDNVFELLVLAGRTLPHAMMMLIPIAWENNKLLDEKLKDFYKFHACFMEPWDGPAAIVFTDGLRVGAVLDRNGLRPARYIVTKNDTLIMASEVGVLDINPEQILTSGRLEPGKIFFIDTEEKRIVNDEEIKEKISQQKPYSVWIKEKMVNLDGITDAPKKENAEIELLELLNAFGYTREDLKLIIRPMAESSQEPTGSMGNDTPHAVLSQNPQLLYNYFKQLFAQVTNPAVDPIREEVVMSLRSFVGPEKNILEETPEHAHKLKIKNPILTNEELEKVCNININNFKTKTISLLFKVNDADNFKNTLESICHVASSAINEGYTFIILSDRGVSKDYAAIPALLAVGAVHQHLVKKALRTQLGIIIESAEPREVHHFALLFGFGADCINPYLAYAAIEQMIKDKELELAHSTTLRANPERWFDFAHHRPEFIEGRLKGVEGLDFETAKHNYIKAVEKGILKILSKMGISTLQSYRGAQIFEALGLKEEVIEQCFTGTVSRIGGAGFAVIIKETLMRHQVAFPERKIYFPSLATGGVYQWKKDGEFHLWNPETIALLQDAVRKGSYEKYKEFAALINDQSKNPTTLRSLFKFRKKTKPIPLREVETVKNIIRRFATGAMSFGSISKEAHETIAITMNRLGGRSNSGEGGEDPARFVRLDNGDSKRSAIKQVASGRFGVTTNYLVNADELQIKIAQGAKPGEGGQLPGHKVSEIIAKTRYTTPGVTLISPPPHHDIYSIEDLAQLIFDLKNVNPYARISVKLVSEVGVGTVAAGVAKGRANMILISGGDGGTGASPLSSIKHAGLPWELGLAETHQTLVWNDLRSRVRLQTDGQMRTGRDVAIAALLGAEEYGFCTVALVVLGCVMLRHCHLNNCSVGLATQDEILRKRFSGKPEYLENYFYFVAEELREIMADLGVRKIKEMVGRTDFLEVNTQNLPWKAKDIDYTRILYKPKVSKKAGVYCQTKQEHKLDEVLDRKLIKLVNLALANKSRIEKSITIKNTDRTTGAMLSGELTRRYGEQGLPENTFCFKFKGVAGQSFGAWLSKGVTFELEGMANDYVGKGISGGKIIIYPDKKATYKAEENIIIGNTAFYGAINGEAYIRGIAGERFCIRNSGLYAVVEAVGDHGCEYMTGGYVAVLGRTGRNFAAGMSGGIAYIYDAEENFKEKCNLSMVGLERLNNDDQAIVFNLICNHHKYTGSSKAKEILDNFSRQIHKFVKVIPKEYKRILEMKEAEEIPELQEVLDG